MKCILAKVDLPRSDCADEVYKVVQKIDILVLSASINFKITNEKLLVKNLKRKPIVISRQLYYRYKIYVSYDGTALGVDITLGSVQEEKTHPDMLVYSSLKAVVTLIARSLAIQFAPNGAVVNSIAPGVILPTVIKVH